MEKDFTILGGDCLLELEKLEENSIDAIVTDPPYEMHFMGKGWDNSGISFNKETWKKCMRVLKPGGYMLAFGGTRTYHRIACAVEDAGFEIRDCIMWLCGSGFPKSMNIGLAIDKKNGVGVKNKYTGANSKNNVYGKGMDGEIAIETQKAQNKWAGWGTALKPSYESIIVARKPFKGSCVDNVIEWGVGGINIDECRVEAIDKEELQKNWTDRKAPAGFNGDKSGIYGSGKTDNVIKYTPSGRFPANTILTYDETDFNEVCGGFPQSKGGSGKGFKKSDYGFGNTVTNFGRGDFKPYNDNGSAARYFYCAKASRKDRDEGLNEFEEKRKAGYGHDKDMSTGEDMFKEKQTIKRNTHPTVKPTSLMQYLVRLVSPRGATILDPFMGSGSTGKAVAYENLERDAGYKFVGIEKDPEYCELAKARIKYVVERQN